MSIEYFVESIRRKPVSTKWTFDKMTQKAISTKWLSRRSVVRRSVVYLANSVDLAYYEPPHQDLRRLQIQLFSSLVLKELRYSEIFCLYALVESSKQSSKAEPRQRVGRQHTG